MQLAEQVLRISEEIQNSAETVVGNTVFKSGRWAAEPRVRIWRGYARQLAERLELTTAQVSNCLSLLDIIGSISLVARSNQFRPALYVVLRPVEIREIIDFKERSLITGDLKTPTKNQRINDSLSRALNRIDKLEYQVKILTANLQKLEDRLRQFGECLGNDGRSSAMPEVSSDGNSELSSDSSG